MLGLKFRQFQELIKELNTYKGFLDFAETAINKGEGKYTVQFLQQAQRMLPELEESTTILVRREHKFLK